MSVVVEVKFGKLFFFVLSKVFKTGTFVNFGGEGNGGGGGMEIEGGEGEGEDDWIGFGGWGMGVGEISWRVGGDGRGRGEGGGGIILLAMLLSGNGGMVKDGIGKGGEGNFVVCIFIWGKLSWGGEIFLISWFWG